MVRIERSDTEGVPNIDDREILLGRLLELIDLAQSGGMSGVSSQILVGSELLPALLEIRPELRTSLLQSLGQWEAMPNGYTIGNLTSPCLGAHPGMRAAWELEVVSVPASFKVGDDGERKSVEVISLRLLTLNENDWTTKMIEWGNVYRQLIAVLYRSTNTGEAWQAIVDLQQYWDQLNGTMGESGPRIINL